MHAPDTIADVCLREDSPPAAAAEPGKRQPSTLLLAALLTIASASPYLPALQYGFVYDDDVQVLQNVAARHSQSSLAYFLSSIWTLRGSAIAVSYRYYRPLFHTWLHLNAALFGDRALWWHLDAILIHLCATVLVFFLLRRHTREPWSALVGALIFGVYPVHIESVVWISGATDPLMAVGVFASFLLWLKNLERPRAPLLIASLTCYAAALLCKETALALPAILFFYALLGIGAAEDGAPEAARRGGVAIRAVLPFLLVTGAYWGIRVVVLRPLVAKSQLWLPASQALLTAPSVFLFYLRHLFWPVDLRLFYDLGVVTSAASPRFWGALLLLAIVAGALVVWWRSQRDNMIPAAAAWLAVPLLPVLNIALFARDDFAHDRYLYVPVLGVAMLASVIARKLIALVRSPGWVMLEKAALALLLASLAGLTAVQSAPWQDNLSLYERAARDSRNSLARTNLASQYATLGRFQDARQLLEPVVQDRPDFWLADYNLGYVDYRLGQLSAAEQLLDRAIALNPTDADSHLYRGLVALRENDPARAEKLVREAIALNPVGEGYHFTLGMILLPRNPDAAKAEMREELKYYPRSGLVKMRLDALERATASHPAQNVSPTK